MKKVFAVLLVLVLSVSMFAGCGGPSLSGKYTLVSMSSEGETYDAAQLANLGLEADSMYLEFIDGSKVKLAFFGEADEGTYKLNGSSISITDSTGDVQSGSINGNKITISAESETLVFEKK